MINDNDIVFTERMEALWEAFCLVAILQILYVNDLYRRCRLASLNKLDIIYRRYINGNN